MRTGSELEERLATVGSRVARFWVVLRSDANRHRLKSLGLWLLIALALLLQASIDLAFLPAIRSFGIRWDVISGAGASLILLFVAAAGFFRVAAGRKFIKRRYVVKPILSTRSAPEFNAQAVTALLLVELGRWQSRALAPEAASPTEAAFTTPYLSIRLRGVGSFLRRVFTGSRDIVIEGVLHDAEKPMRLDVWADVSYQIISEPVESDPSNTNGLSRAVHEVVLRLIEELDPVLRSQIHWYHQNYAEAIELLRRQPPTLNRDRDLALLFMACHRNDLARALLVSLPREHFLLSWSQRADVAELLAALNIAVGDYGAARAILEELLRKNSRRGRDRRAARKRRLLLLMGNNECGNGEFARAMQYYDSAELSSIEEIARRTRLPPAASLVDSLLECEIRPIEDQESLLEELGQIYDAKATCRRLLGLDPSFDYATDLHILSVLRDTTPYSSQRSMRTAQVTEYWAGASARHGELDTAARLFAEAGELYGRAYSGVEPGAREFGIKTDIAWCECGKWWCRRCELDLKPKPQVPVRVEEGLALIFQLLEELSEADKTTFVQSWTRAHRLSEDVTAYYDELTAAANVLVSCLLAKMHIHDLAQLLPRSEVGAAPAGIPVLEEARVRSAFEQRMQLTPRVPDPPRLFEIYWGIVTRLALIGHAGEQANPLAERIRLETEAKSMLHRCLDRFESLSASPYHEAERAYGMACVTANWCDHILFVEPEYIMEVARHLWTAIDKSTSGPVQSVFVGRARTDSDFDAIREHPAIRRLLYGGAGDELDSAIREAREGG